MKSLYRLSSFAPSSTDLLNLYSAYNIGGPNFTTSLASTIIADKLLIQKYGLTKNYVSNSAFWGYMAYKAIGQVHTSKAIGEPYKPILYTLFASIAGGMVYFGKDIFAEKHDLNKMCKSISLTAEFFDKHKTISGMEMAFKNGYGDGVKYTFQHFKDIILNKFILYTLAQQALEVTKMIIFEKYLQASPFGKISIILALKEQDSFNKIFKLALNTFAREIVELTHKKLTNKLKAKIDKHIKLELAGLAFKDGITETIMQLDKSLTTLPEYMSKISNNVFSDLSSTINTLLRPFIQGNNIGQANIAKIIKDYPSLLLLEGLIQTIFSFNNLDNTRKYLERKFYGEQIVLQDPDIEKNLQNLGNCNIIIAITPEDYAYKNIQEIAKLGANQFIYSKLSNYLTRATTGNLEANQTVIGAMLNLFKDLIHNLTYASQISSLNITQEQIPLIEANLKICLDLLGLSELNMGGQQDVMAQVQSTLHALRGVITKKGPERILSEDMTLSIDNYHLNKSEKEIIFIDHLVFEPGCIYAVTGKIGLGKTTFLTDIAQCLAAAFSSSGQISYPIDDEQEIPKIFCGTVSFSPPNTTLFEKLTYRLPEEYRNSHKEDLETAAIGFFQHCGQSIFTQEKLQEKGNNDKLNLSTGQSKLVTLISAILYKEYLKKPVLFIIDETLANLDTDTTNLICALIKDKFKDSIVISVDHQAKGNTTFYDKFVDLGEFESIEPILSDEGSSSSTGERVLSTDWNNTESGQALVGEESYHEG